MQQGEGAAFGIGATFSVVQKHREAVRHGNSQGQGLGGITVQTAAAQTTA
jgi:hypothetical protein